MSAPHRSADRDARVLFALLGRDWSRPMDIGATDGSHHSATLGRLVARGLVERETRRGLVLSRPSYVYRLTTTGRAAASDLARTADETIERLTDAPERRQE